MDEVLLTSLKLLTPPLVDWLTFSGSASDDVLLFAQAVHLFALVHGRHEPGAWMAASASGCLENAALDWFEDLDLEIRRDWANLRPAMITEFRWDKFTPFAPAAAPEPRV
ncbi:hypothetical protein FRB98_004238, partial [Tulasnella sp. 332]